MYGTGRSRRSSPNRGRTVVVYCRKYTVGYWRSWRRACGYPGQRPWPCGDCVGVLTAPAGGVVVAVEGTVLSSRRDGVPRVRQAEVLIKSRFRPRPRVVPMPFEGSAEGKA